MLKVSFKWLTLPATCYVYTLGPEKKNGIVFCAVNYVLGIKHFIAQVAIVMWFCVVSIDSFRHTFLAKQGLDH